MFGSSFPHKIRVLSKDLNKENLDSKQLEKVLDYLDKYISDCASGKKRFNYLKIKPFLKDIARLVDLEYAVMKVVVSDVNGLLEDHIKERIERIVNSDELKKELDEEKLFFQTYWMLLNGYDTSHDKNVLYKVLHTIDDSIIKHREFEKKIRKDLIALKNIKLTPHSVNSSTIYSFTGVDDKLYYVDKNGKLITFQGVSPSSFENKGHYWVAHTTYNDSHGWLNDAQLLFDTKKLLIKPIAVIHHTDGRVVQAVRANDYGLFTHQRVCPRLSVDVKTFKFTKN